MDLLPINKNIIVEVDKEAEVTTHGVHVAHSKGERTASKAIKGKVVSIALDAYVFTQDAKDKGELEGLYVAGIGQTVWIAKWEGQELSYNGKEFIIIKPEHILVVSEEKKNT